MKSLNKSFGLAIAFVVTVSLGLQNVRPVQAGDLKSTASLAKSVSGFPVTVGEPVQPHEVNIDLRRLPQIKAASGASAPRHLHPLLPSPLSHGAAPAAGAGSAPAVQTKSPSLSMPSTVASFAGLDLQNWGSGWPPDPNGDVGPNNYMEAVNTSIGIFDKTGTPQTRFSFDSFWSSAATGTPCDTSNQGDPIALYDPLADRWIFADFAWSNSNIEDGPYYECFAVSKTSDPVSGNWWVYAVRTDDVSHPWLADYPKLGVWPDGIYMSANMFDCLDPDCLNADYDGVRLWAFNKTDMESGAALHYQPWDLDTSYGSLLPSNLRGSPPPAGRPNYFVMLESDTSNLDVMKFHVDWTTPANTTVTGPSVVSATYTLPTSRIPEKNGQLVDSLGDRLMMQNQYRKIGATESLWLTHTVVSGGVTGIRWYQVNVTGGTVVSTPVQVSTYQPDSNYRWMPSLAVDSAGDMAVGYSVSSSSLFPSIRYAGRLVTDPLNTLSQGEATLVAGTGAQNNNGFNRWGDYSAMTVDPADDCTFWYVNEYYLTVSSNWQTRIGSFKFPSCQSPLISGNAGAAGATLTYTGGSTSADGSGNYSFKIPAGWTGTVTPSKTGSTFTPDHKDYTNITTDQPNQDYTANTAPTDISLSNADIGEAQPSGTAIGTFTNNDPDIGDSWTYTLVTGGGGCPGTDNASFQTSVGNGGTLESNAVFDYETKSSYDICVQVADTQAHTFQEPFTITILNRLGVVVNLASAAANDGWILESAAGSGSGGTLNASASTFQLGDDASNRQYRSILSFDTSAIPVNAVLTSVRLNIRRQGISGTNPFNTMGSLLVDTRKPFFGTVAGLEIGDFNAAEDHLGTVNIPNTPDASGWYSADLPKADFDAVNIGGTSQFRLRFATASNNNGVADLLKFYSGSGSTASRPLLIVEYALPSATLTINSVPANDGWILESAQGSGLGGSLNTSASTFPVGDNALNRQYRSILSFNTSALPDNAIITGVTLQVRQQGSSGDPFGTLGSLLVDTRKPFFDGGLTLQKADFNASADHLGAASIPNTPDVNGWYSVGLPSPDFDAVNPFGTSQFRLRFATPTNGDNTLDELVLFSGNASLDSRPILSVDFMLP